MAARFQAPYVRIARTAAEQYGHGLAQASRAASGRWVVVYARRARPGPRGEVLFEGPWRVVPWPASSTYDGFTSYLRATFGASEDEFVWLAQPESEPTPTDDRSWPNQ